MSDHGVSERRTGLRRKWVIVAGSLTAVVIGVVGAIVLRNANRAGEAGSDLAAVVTTVGPSVTPVDLDWSAVVGTVGSSRRTIAAEDGTFYALSTVPGKLGRVPDSFEPAIYWTSDGLAWDIVVPGERVFVADVTERDGVLYAVGTALGGTEVVATVSSTMDLGRSWSVTRLPVQARPPTTLGVKRVEATTNIAAAPSGIVAVVQSRFEVDVGPPLPGIGQAPGEEVLVTENGVEIVDWMLYEEITSGCPAVVGPKAEGALMEFCRAVRTGNYDFAVVGRFTWDELGIAPEVSPVFSEIFVSDDGVNFEAAPSPFAPGQALSGLYAVDPGFMAFEQGGAAWRSADGRSWVELDGLPQMERVLVAGTVGEVAVVVGDAARQPLVAWEAPDGSWASVDLRATLDELGVPKQRRTSSASVGPLGVLIAIATRGEVDEGPDVGLVYGAMNDEWAIAPLAGLLPAGPASVSWLAVGPDELLMQVTKWDTPHPSIYQVIGASRA